MRYRSCKDSFCDWLFTSAFFYGHQQLKTLRLYQSIGYQKENVNKIERCFFLCQLRKEQAANCFNRDGHILSIFHLLWAIHRDTHPFSLSLSLSLSFLLKEPDETRWWRDWPEFGTGDTHSLRVEQWRGDKGTLSLRGKRDPQSAHEWMWSSFTLLLLVHKLSRLLIALALGSGGHHRASFLCRLGRFSAFFFPLSRSHNGLVKVLKWD